MCVHLFGVTSSPGVSTYALRKIAVDHRSKNSKSSIEIESIKTTSMEDVSTRVLEKINNI